MVLTTTVLISPLLLIARELTSGRGHNLPVSGLSLWLAHNTGHQRFADRVIISNGPHQLELLHPAGSHVRFPTPGAVSLQYPVGCSLSHLTRLLVSVSCLSPHSVLGLELPQTLRHLPTD